MSQPDAADVVSGVGMTALAAAAGRAVESSRPDPLIDDPLAAAFVAAANAPVPFPVRWPAAGTELSDQEILLLYGAGYVGVRSRYCDDYLLAAGADGVRQVVLLAAGLDARAFRLDWPAGVRLFELDQPGVMEFKEEVLHERGAVARCDRTAVPADLSADWARPLTDAGFTATEPTVWLAEGLLQYLSPAAEGALFTRIHELSAPGSRLLVERSANLAALAAGGEDAGRRLREVSQRSGIPMDRLIATEARPDPTVLLAELGWTVTEEQVAAVAERYHRDLANPGLPLPSALSSPSAASSAGSPGEVRTSFLAAGRAA